MRKAVLSLAVALLVLAVPGITSAVSAAPLDSGAIGLRIDSATTPTVEAAPRPHKPRKPRKPKKPKHPPHPARP